MKYILKAQHSGSPLSSQKERKYGTHEKLSFRETFLNQNLFCRLFQEKLITVRSACQFAGKNERGEGAGATAAATVGVDVGDDLWRRRQSRSATFLAAGHTRQPRLARLDAARHPRPQRPGA